MLVSIIIPTYNREKTIGAVVESALAQTYEDKEIIVVNDGSTDETEKALAPFSGLIQVINQPNAGPSAARNRGVAASKGAIIAFLDSDDFWLPEKIEKQMVFFEDGSSEICCCICSATVKNALGMDLGNTFDLSGLKLQLERGIWTNPQEVLATRFILFNQVVAVRRECFDTVGGFNENLRLLEDHELAMKLAVLGPWGIIKTPLVVKYNDEDGLGVGCMADHDKHLETSISVLGEILVTHHGLSPKAKKFIEIEIADMHLERSSRELIKNGNITGTVAGKFLSLVIRYRKAVRRRLPSWPQPDIRAISK